MAGNEPRRLDVMVVVPWYAGSHRAWADALVDASRHRVRTVTLPGEHWRWRVHGGPVTLAAMIADDVAANGVPDACIVSSLTDTAALLGLARRELGGVPVVQYQHESQLLHPRAPGQRRAPRDEPAALAEWRSMLAVDEVWFNSSHHRDAYLTRVGPDLLARGVTPSHVHLVERVRARSRVVPVGVELSGVEARPRAGSPDPPVIVFNQRWDLDKAPGRVLAALDHAAASGRPFDVVLAGPRGRTVRRPSIPERLAPRVRTDAELDRASYLEALRHADLVVADADHEFFGIAPVEAVASGCVPLFPRRANYPDLVDGDDRFLHDGHDLVPRLCATIDRVASGEPALRTAADALAKRMRRFDARVVTAEVDRRLEVLAAGART